MKEFNFLKYSKVYYAISALIILAAVVVTAVFGLNVDIEFKGGSIATYSYTGEIKTSDVEKAVKDATGYSSKIQISENSATGDKNVVISIAEELDSDKQIKMTDKLEKDFKDNKVKLVESSSVNAMNGKNFFIKCLIAVFLAAVLMAVYIAVRFRKIGGWSAGLTAVMALIHDLIVAFAVYAIFRIEIGGNFMAVMLTILGYSINDTIVVFDRVRENNDIHGKKLSVRDNMQLSLNQSFTRAVHTSVTTLAALTVVIVVALIFNINSMFDFVFPMAVGLVSGVYSSMFLAPCVWVAWRENQDSKKSYAKKKK